MSFFCIKMFIGRFQELQRVEVELRACQGRQDTLSVQLERARQREQGAIVYTLH